MKPRPIVTMAMAALSGLAAILADAELLAAPTERSGDQQQPAIAKVPSSRTSSTFRVIYACDDKNPASAMALGEIKGWKSVVLTGSASKQVATVKESGPSVDFEPDIRVTRLELPEGVRCAHDLAILAPPQSVEVIRVTERRDDRAVARVAAYLKVRGRLPDSADPTVHHSTNYRMVEPKVLQLGPNVTAIQAKVLYDTVVYDTYLRKYTPPGGPDVEKPSSDMDQQISMLFVVGKDVAEIGKGFLDKFTPCVSFESAFTISKRPHIYVSASGCENGELGRLVFDLSGPTPKVVFGDWDLST